MLSEINSHRKTNTELLPLYEVSKVAKLLEAERTVVARDWGKGKWGVAVERG